MENCAAGNVSCTSGNGKVTDGEGWFNIPIRSGGRKISDGCSGAILSTGHPINGVIDYDCSDTDISAGSVDKMVTTNSGNIAITGKYDDFQFRIGEFKSGGKRNGPAVGGVK